MPKRSKSLLKVEAQRVRLQDELSRQYRAAQNGYFSNGRNAADLERMDAISNRSDKVNRIARRYDRNIRAAVGISPTVNSYFGDRALITHQVPRRTYMGLANG